MTIRYAPIERYSPGEPSKGLLRYQTDYGCDLDHALALGMYDAEYVALINSNRQCCQTNPWPHCAVCHSHHPMSCEE